MIRASHAVLYTTEPEAVRAIFRDVFKWSHVGESDWPIFALPPLEAGVHPCGPDAAGRHEFYLVCDDLASTVEELRAAGIEVRDEPGDQGWGIVATLALPGGLDIGLYEPRHDTAV